MATLISTAKIARDIRGALTRVDTGVWRVLMPMGIKNRVLKSFEFNWSNDTTKELIGSLRYSKSNAKLKKTAKKYEELTGERIRLWAFNLPALMACPGAAMCAFFCYALQGQFAYRNVMESRAHNFALLHELYSRGGEALVADALEAMLRNLVKETPKKRDVWVRIHDSGDMFKLWYFRAWSTALARVPEVQGYAYTKAIGMIRRVDLPQNLRITQSVGGTMDSQIDKSLSHSLVTETHEERERLGYVNGNDSDIPAMLGEIKVGLVYHGTEKLEEAA